MLADEEHDLLWLAVELDRLDTGRQLAGRGGVGNLAPNRARRRPHGRAVALDEVGGAAVVRALGEQDADRLSVRVEVAVRGQERVDQDQLVVRLVAHDRHLFRPVLARLPVRVR